MQMRRDSTDSAKNIKENFNYFFKISLKAAGLCRKEPFISVCMD